MIIPRVLTTTPRGPQTRPSRSKSYTSLKKNRYCALWINDLERGQHCAEDHRHRPKTKKISIRSPQSASEWVSKPANQPTNKMPRCTTGNNKPSRLSPQDSSRFVTAIIHAVTMISSLRPFAPPGRVMGPGLWWINMMGMTPTMTLVRIWTRGMGRKWWVWNPEWWLFIGIDPSCSILSLIPSDSTEMSVLRVSESFIDVERTPLSAEPVIEEDLRLDGFSGLLRISL